MVMLVRKGPTLTKRDTDLLQDYSFAVLTFSIYFCIDAHPRDIQATDSRPSPRQRINAVEATHDGVYTVLAPLFGGTRTISSSEKL